MYLCKKIFTSVHMIQRPYNSLCYNDIVEMDWMIKYNHIGLLKDKLKRTCLLSGAKNLFPLINRELELFMVLYHQYKQIQIQQKQVIQQQELVSHFEMVINYNNISAVKWMCENGYAVELQEKNLVFSKDTDPEILRYLITNGWFRVTYRSILANYKHTLSHYSIPVLQVFRDNTPTPINNSQASEIINELLNYPIPHVFETLSPLFQDNWSLNVPLIVSFPKYFLGTGIILEYIIKKNLCPRINSFLQLNLNDINMLLKFSNYFDIVSTMDQYNESFKANAKQVLLKQQIPPIYKELSSLFEKCISLRERLYTLPADAIHVLLEHGLQLNRHWFSRCLKYGTKALFFNLFKKLDIRVYPDRILFQPNPYIDESVQLSHNWYGTDIDVLDFLSKQGTEIVPIFHFSFYTSLVEAYNKKSDQFKLIVDLMNLGILNCYLILNTCINLHNTVLFKYIYQHRINLSSEQCEMLLSDCLALQDYELLEILSSFDIKPNRQQLLIGLKNSIRFNLLFLQELFNPTTIDVSDNETLDLLLNLYIKNMCFPHVKYLLSTFIYGSIEPFREAIAESNDLPIIDYIYKNKGIFQIEPNYLDWAFIYEKASKSSNIIQSYLSILINK